MGRREQTSQHWKLLGAFVGALAGVTAAAAVYARLLEPRSLTVRDFDIELPSVPPELDGTRIAFLSDIHLGGPGYSYGVMNRVTQQLSEIRPDLILLGGDFFDHGVRVQPEPDWSAIPEIAPTYAVPGNHDYKHSRENSEDIFEHLSNNGITVLRNESVEITLRGESLLLVGLDDPYTGRARYDEAIRHVRHRLSPRIMLVHAGMIAKDLPVASADLMLTGHTHGAQIRFSPFRTAGPLDIFWWLDRVKNQPLSPYRQGLFRVRGSLLYVRNGLGTTTIGARFLAPPELAVFRLRAGTGNPDVPCEQPERYISRYEQSREWNPDGSRGLAQ